MFKKILTSAAILFLAITSVNAADLKVGVFDEQLVLSKIPQVNLIQSNLQAKFKDRVDEAKTQRDQAIEQEKAFKRDAMTMTEAQRIAKQRELQKLGNDLKTNDANLKEDWQIARNEEVNKVRVKIQQTVSKLAKAEQFDLILRIEAVAFRKEAIDVSNKVITILSNPAG